jgi:hypothetical protein
VYSNRKLEAEKTNPLDLDKIKALEGRAFGVSNNIAHWTSQMKLSQKKYRPYQKFTESSSNISANGRCR